MVAPFLAAHNVPILEAVPDCDLIFSAGNHHIFKAAEIAKAKRGIINFHAAPLPEYAGSAVPAFAILNEESQFGVTFHYVIPEIDAGDILHVERFPIDAHWTAKMRDDFIPILWLRFFMLCLTRPPASCLTIPSFTDGRPERVLPPGRARGTQCLSGQARQALSRSRHHQHDPTNLRQQGH
jgi:hypothetical protein